MSQPLQLENQLYRLLHSEQIAGFNRNKPAEGIIDLSNADLRGLDLRGLDASRLDLRGAYFRGADLRGLDLRQAHLEGASIGHARISGVYFPVELEASEILMSMQFGTRLRYRL